MSKNRGLSLQYKSKPCGQCGVTGKYYAKGKCNSCYTKHRLDIDPEAKARYKRNGRSKNLQTNYGITLEDYDRMYESQGGRCAICEDTDLGSTKFGHFAVDHDHRTGQVRGLLCSNCNLGLGHFHDDPTKVVAALVYLRKFI